MFWHHEQNAPRRKDLLEYLEGFERWHGELNNLPAEAYHRLRAAMGEVGPATLDDLVALLGQLKTACHRLSALTPPDLGGRTNLVTERLGTAHGQLVVSLIQRIEGGTTKGELGSKVKITGGPGGTLTKVAAAVCRYATGDDHEDSIRHKARYAVLIWNALKELEDGTPAQADELAKLLAL
jgi:hypothetical protein